MKSLDWKAYKIAKLMGDITTLAVLISDHLKPDVFVEYSGHVKWMNMKIYPKGYIIDSSINISEQYLYSYDECECIDRKIQTLQEVRKQLIKILKKGEIDLTKLPYEDKEVVKVVRNYLLRRAS